MTEWKYAGASPWLENPACPQCKETRGVVVSKEPGNGMYGKYDCNLCRIMFWAAPKEMVESARGH